jgi:nucleotide-binding universal stress UspA family protein
MYTRILIPLDGSSLAEQVLPYGRFLAKALAVPVQLLKVIDLEALDSASGRSAEAFGDAPLSRMIESTQAYLEMTAQSFASDQISCSVAAGTPPDVIVQRASSDQNTLIVMATHGGSGIRRWLLGSVAHQLLQQSANDMFLIPVTDEGRTSGEAMLKTVILPLDGSLSAEQVAPCIEELRARLELKLVLLRVGVCQPASTEHPFRPTMDEWFKRLGDELYEYLRAKVGELRRKGLFNVETVVKFGYAADEIIGTARETRNSFVAMRTHRESGPNRWALGSVTHAVVRRSRRPVLVIRSQSIRHGDERPQEVVRALRDDNQDRHLG